MTSIDSESGHSRWPVFFELGFRPFFLSATVFAGIIMPLWVLVFSGDMSVPGGLSSRDWHLHEMVFGYVPAVIAGFLLTAIPNWTGRPPIKGGALALLWGLWVFGRVAMSFSGLSPLVAAIMDGVFLFALSALAWREILAGKNKRNFPIAMFVTMLALTNAGFHFQVLMEASTGEIERLALGVIAILLALIGGRITPAFTLNWMKKRGMEQTPPMFDGYDKITMLVSAITVLAWVVMPEDVVTGYLFGFAAILTLVRVARWRGLAVVSEPLLFILHIGQLWVFVWLALMALAVLAPDVIDQTSAMHALSAGTVGTMTLAVMTRASLGHSGLPLSAGAGTTMVFVLVILGSVIRICANWLPFDLYFTLGLSGMVWASGFLLFVILWGPLLIGRVKKPESTG